MSRVMLLVVLAVALYVGSYVVFRQFRVEILEERHQPASYVIYPEG